TMLSEDSEFTNNQALVSNAGAIYCQNDLAEECDGLEIYDSLFTGNSSYRDGGAVWTGGDSVIRRSDFLENVASYGDGGALYVQIYDAGMELEVRRTQFSRNQGHNGGAISIRDGDVTVKRSSLVDNVAEGVGGGIYGYWVGPQADSLTIVNSTIARNSASTAGGVHAYADASMWFTAMVDNSANEGQVHDVSGTFDLYRSIVTHDAVPATGPECLGVFSGESNLLDGATCGTGLTYNLGAHNNTELLGLRLWGGRTLSYGLTSASLAVDAANNCIGANGVLSLDQRGESRPAGADCDLGPWERQ
ncbi:MAG: choice-of-anchor Q domain-containing protein, partial [Gammaproteobacteria bacterium]